MSVGLLRQMLALLLALYGGPFCLFTLPRCQQVKQGGQP